MKTEILKILLIEDNPGDARLVKEMLRDAENENGGRFKFDVVHVDRLHIGLGKLALGGVDVVLLDLSLPDAHGFDVFSGSRSIVPDAPIIIMTGLEDEHSVKMAIQRGAQDYLLKGKIDSDKLAHAIRHAIERHRLLVELEKSRQLERHMALHDSLTDLPNRQLFQERLNGTIDYVNRYGGAFAVMFLDLDGFKKVNDIYGHETGDLLLKEVAGRLTGSLRKSDIAARLGGDEFVILLNNIVQKEDVNNVARSLLYCLAEPYEINSIKARISGSIGIAIFPQDADNISDLMRYADTAMYDSKKSGGNRLCFYQDRTKISQTVLFSIPKQREHLEKDIAAFA